MKIRKYLLIMFFVLISSTLFAQVGDGVLKLETNYFYNFEIFYLADFNFNDGSLSPNIFGYSLSYTPNDPVSGTPISIKIEFEMIADVPSLGLENRRIFYVLTRAFDFKGEVKITSQDLDMNMDNIYYVTGEPVTGLGADETDIMPEEEFAGIQQTVMGTGKLPAGGYTFRLGILNEDNTMLLSEYQTIAVSNPTTLDLVSPGGALEDGLEIYTTFPVFLWESPESMWNNDNCPECGYYIRVAEYNSATHSSVEDALSDDASLPYPDDGDYYRLPIVPVVSFGTTQLFTAENSFQYPLTGAKPLEWGIPYVYHVKKIYPTTSGAETVESDIYAFYIPSMGGEETEGGTEGGTGGANQYLELLEQILGSDTFNQLFTGQLNGYLPTGVVILNGTQPLTLDQLSVLVGQFLAGDITIQTITIE
ncbi:MAG: hypothetical protein ISS81_00015 [Candidatus Marinimicrobia bacterium]|nr:hypothetical protein [Candidatus Neomarinimicrobiota bacterium]